MGIGLKLTGLVLGFVGIVAAFLDLLGVFDDKEKLALARMIRESGEGIPRTTAGFERFMKEFPPPPGVDAATVTHIVLDRLVTHDQFPISITVRYLAADQRTLPVASYEDVRRWSEKTPFGWMSWVIAAVGFFTVAALDLKDILGR